MRNIWAIFKRELLSFFVSPIAYFVITGFTLLIGYFFFIYLAAFQNWYNMAQMMPMARRPLPNLNEVVIQNVYQTMLVILVFLVPLLTMRTIADEKRRGTFELLITSPLSVTQIVLGKFLGLAAVLTIMLLIAASFPLLLVLFASPEVPPILTGFLGVFLCTLAFASVGMAASSFTENQIVAGVTSMVTLLLLYAIQGPAESMTGIGAEIVKALSPVEQVANSLKGVITLKNVIYFLSLIFLGLFVSQRALEAHRWR